MNTETEIPNTPEGQMTPEEQRIAIAKACGWKKGHLDASGYDIWINPNGAEQYISYVPHYPDDLNAMHKAEKACLDTDSMNPISYCPYADALQDVCFDKTHWWCATAAQRAEALLRTLGLWQESQSASGKALSVSE